MNNQVAGLGAKPTRHYGLWVCLVFLEYLALGWAAWAAVQDGLPWYHRMGLLLSLALLVGVSKYSCGRFFRHRGASLARWLTRLALAPVAYGPFSLQAGGSHGNRAIPAEDPACLRFGESFSEFLPRRLGACFSASWIAEVKRLRAAGRSAYSLRNANLAMAALTLLCFSGLILWLGWAVLPFLLLQAVAGMLLLEYGNFREQYRFHGQLQVLENDGQAHRDAQYSWNGAHIVTNVFFFCWPHSEHGVSATEDLRHTEATAPALPAVGHIGMFLQLFLPPLWLKVMHSPEFGQGHPSERPQDAPAFGY